MITEEYLKKRLSIFSFGIHGIQTQCFYCRSKEDLTKDHFYPSSLGGILKVKSCRKCNLEKDNMTPPEWIKYLQAKLDNIPDNEENKRDRIIIRLMIRKTVSLWEKVKWSTSKLPKTKKVKKYLSK